MYKAWKAVYTYFDKLEDRVRFRLSRRPLLYAIVGAIGVALLWKGVDDMATQLGIDGIFAFALGLAMMLVTGLLVAFFIGDSIIISGFKKEKKLADDTEAELQAEEVRRQRLAAELHHIEHDIEELKRRQPPHIRL